MRILAVEDDMEYLEMLQVVMESLGHTVMIAPNGVEGLRQLETQPVDVIISDVRMPEMDGVEFHERVRDITDHRNTPFIFLTGVSDLTAVRDVCRTDADLLLQKPFPVDKLLELFSGKLK